MAYLRSRKAIRRNGRVMQAMGATPGRYARYGSLALSDDAGTCLDNCDSTSGPTGSSPDPTAYAQCNTTCAQLFPSGGTTSSGSSSSPSTTSSSSSGSSGSSSIWTGVGNLLGGIGKTLATPNMPFMAPTGPDPTTLLLIGGAIVGVVLLTRKKSS